MNEDKLICLLEDMSKKMEKQNELLEMQNKLRVMQLAAMAQNPARTTPSCSDARLDALDGIASRIEKRLFGSEELEG